MAQTYSFDKIKVLDILRENRDAHTNIFLEALEGYRKTAIMQFEDNIKKIKKGKLVSGVYLKLPINQTKDYDRVIKMLELSEGNLVDLTEEQFANYMLDDWSWKQSFLTTNSTYSLSASTALAASGDDEDD